MKVLATDTRIPEKFRDYFKTYLKTKTPVDYRDLKIDTAEEFIHGKVEPNGHQVKEKKSKIKDRDERYGWINGLGPS